MAMPYAALWSQLQVPFSWWVAMGKGKGMGVVVLVLVTRPTQSRIVDPATKHPPPTPPLRHIPSLTRTPVRHGHHVSCGGGGAGRGEGG